MTKSASPTHPSSKNGGVPANCATQPCPEDCKKKVFPAKEVSEEVTEVISGAPAGEEAWNGTYKWTVKFKLEALRASCSVKVTVKIKVTGTITDAQKNGWKSAIETKWNNKVKLLCSDPACKEACPGGYAVSFVVEYVTSGEHYVVKANNDPPDGVRSVTPDMGKWGVDDTVDVTHEFGHMLGAPEQYHTINGTVYGAGRQAGKGVMNNPAGDPEKHNYELIRKHAAAVMGVNCTTEVA